MFDSFGEGGLYYLPKILPFLNKREFNNIKKMDALEFDRFMNKKNYESLTKKAFYECGLYFNNVKINIYLNKKNNRFIQCEKCLATHVLEQVFDEDDQLISEELKKL